MLRASLIALVASLSLVACTSATQPDLNDGAGTQAPPVLDALPRALSAGEQTVIGAANEFSFALFRQLDAAQPSGNVFASPLSVSMALGMTMNGAAGETYEQMRTTLAFGSASEAQINQSYKSLISLLRGLDSQVDFRIANSIWYRNNYPFHQSFLDAGRTWFDAQVSGLDFNSAQALPAINGWVSTATNGKITNILDEIDPNDVMYLINAIYFKGSWRTKFDPAATIDAPFHAVGGDQPAKLMHRDGEIRYAATPELEAVDLPYGNDAFSMTVLLPAPGKSVDDVLAALKGDAWSALTQRLYPADVDLHLPKFKLEWERDLVTDLKALGMVSPFGDATTDFTRMSPAGRELFIAFVQHKTYVDVNEQGTEAAAVTNVGIRQVSAPQRVTFRVDRPFVFVLRERLSGTILFMGKIVKLP